MIRAGRWSLPVLTVVLAVVTAVTWPASALAATDWDGDGAIETDCRPLDPAVHPAATDHPDLAFEDMNCDGIDGDLDGAWFVVPSGGNDLNAGSSTAPFATIQRAIDAARASATKDVYVATGTYNQALSLPTDADGVRIYGGYQAGAWTRTTATATTVNGAPETALLNGATDVVLQLLTLNGTRGLGGTSAYGVRAVGGSEVALIRTTTTAGPGATGNTGSTGSTPFQAAAGAPGDQQNVPTGMGGTACDYAGTGAFVSQFGNGTDGGAGGAGGEETNDGENGLSGANGSGFFGGSLGAGGTDNSGDADNPADTENGKDGGVGGVGSPGGHGAGGANDFGLAGAAFTGRPGAAGLTGGTGYGGGGGGGGAGDGSGLSWSAGAGGGQGGDGGSGGTQGGPGFSGGGSFGVYLHDSQAAVADGSTLQAGAGGAGGAGGSGAPGGAGGDGGPGATTVDCPGKEGGHGGDGGPGGQGGSGGNGGGGAGGPSVGVARMGTSLATVRGDSTAAAGTPGAGGVGGAAGATGDGATGQSGGMRPDSSAVTDFDSDGVTDSSDACVELAAPGTGNGCPTRAAALPDTDSDGVPNSQDACPSTAAGATDANENGCPDDPDGDGVLESNDACPSTPAGTNDANGDGCPDNPNPGGTPPSGNPGGGNPPADTLAPSVSSVARAQRALKAKALVWTATSDEACALTVSAMLGRKKLGSLTKPLAPGAATKLKMRLSKKSLGLLRKALTTRKKVTVVLKSACLDAVGNKQATSTKLVVKR